MVRSKGWLSAVLWSGTLLLLLLLDERRLMLLAITVCCLHCGPIFIFHI